LRKGVSEMKGHVLSNISAFKMREISAAVPLGSGILLNGIFHNANREIGVPGGVGRVAHSGSIPLLYFTYGDK